MGFNYFLILIFGSILMCIYDIFITNRISKECARKCKYECDKCENWKCFYHYCKKEREL